MYENVAVPYEIHWKVCLDVGSKPTGSIEGYPQRISILVVRLTEHD